MTIKELAEAQIQRGYLTGKLNADFSNQVNSYLLQNGYTIAEINDIWISTVGKASKGGSTNLEELQLPSNESQPMTIEFDTEKEN